MASAKSAVDPVAEAAPGSESVPLKSTESEKTETADTENAAPTTEETPDDGLFGAWRGFTGLFGGEGAADGPKSPSLGQAASEIAATASTELEHAGKVAQKQLGKAAEELGKGWGNLNTFLDEILSPATEETPGGSSTAARNVVDGAAERLHERFPGIDASEEAVGTYECSLVQKYRCSLNSATPEKTFPLAGVLYVTPLHMAMYVMDDGGAFGAPFGVVVPFSDVARVQRGQKAMLRIVTKEKSSYVFAGFPSDGEFKAALDLLEHLVGSAQPQNEAEVTPVASEEVGEAKSS